MAKLPPNPVGVPPGSSYWNDWYEKLRTFVDQITTNVDWTIVTGVPPNLTALGATAGTGLYSITGLGTSAVRSFTLGTGGLLTLSNGDGVAANPQIDLPLNIAPTWTGKHTWSAGGVDIAAPFRASGATVFPTGAGVEIGHNGTLGIISVFDRSALAWQSMVLRGLTFDFRLSGTTSALLNSSGHSLQIAGMGYAVKEGVNAKMGTAALVAGTVVVNTTAVTANSRIFLTGQNSSGTAGELTISARVAGTSFTITSSSAADTRSVAWLIFEPS